MNQANIFLCFVDVVFGRFLDVVVSVGKPNKRITSMHNVSCVCVCVYVYLCVYTCVCLCVCEGGSDELHVIG